MVMLGYGLPMEVDGRKKGMELCVYMCSCECVCECICIGVEYSTFIIGCLIKLR